MAFSPDGRLLAVAGDDGVTRLFSVAQRELVGICVEEGLVESVAFSPDGHTLVTGGSDGTVYLWRVRPERSANELVLA